MTEEVPVEITNEEENGASASITNEEENDASTSNSDNTANSIKKKFISFLICVVIVAAVELFVFLGKGYEDPFFGSGIPILQIVGIFALVINFGALVPAFLLQTEKFYDLTGSLTYLSCTIYCMVAGRTAFGEFRTRPTIAAVLTLIWSSRLGVFLFRRVMRDGRDVRFTELKKNFFRFAITWGLQALWCFITAYPVYIVNSESGDPKFGPLDVIGILIWVFGFGFEAISDQQKSAFKTDPANRGKFIDSGLWSVSRHPNYFGEMTLWVGMFLLCVSAFRETQYAAVISPIFVILLITKISGINLLEAKGEERYGKDPKYQEYKKKVAVLVPYIY